jgi:hypothetical protein
MSSRKYLLVDFFISPACVIQIGTSSGREIAWIAEQFPQVRFIGTDIFLDIIEYAQQAHNGENLEFQVFSAANLRTILDQLKGHRVIVFSIGSLQYVQPEHLDAFFNSLGSVIGVLDLEVMLAEPASVKYGDPLSLAGSQPRGSFSYTHNYRKYAERNGFNSLGCNIIHPYAPSDPLHGFTVQYYWHGKVSNK